MPFCEKMANIGSEVGRALKWRSKGRVDYSQNAFERALELIDLTLDVPSNFAYLKEVARVREALIDYFLGTNQFGSTDPLWQKYFDHFAYAARSGMKGRA